MELSCRSFPFWAFKRPAFYLIHILLDFNKNNIVKNFKSVPTSMNDNSCVVKLGCMPHSRQGSFSNNFWKYPFFFFSVKNKNIVEYLFASISLASSKNDKIFSEVCWWMAISWRRGSSFYLGVTSTYIIEHCPIKFFLWIFRKVSWLRLSLTCRSHEPSINMLGT